MQFEKIRNYEELLSHGDAEARETVLKVTDQVLSRLDIYKYLKNLIKKDGNILTIGKKVVDLDQYDRVYAFSSGKAGNHMARAFEEILGDRLTAGVTIIKIKEDIEKFSIIRAVAAVERCDVAVLVIDAQEGITDQDTKIAGIAHERGKAAIIAVNKWDAIEKDDKTMQEMRAKLEKDFSFMSYAPILFISALTGQRVDRLFQLIKYVDDQAAMRITTGMLNSFLADATARVQPPTDKGRRLKIYYMTQAGIRPPHFVFFCNDAKLFHFSYQRYLENQVRATFGLEGTPIRLTVRQRGDKEE